jgi:hypothetical protein
MAAILCSVRSQMSFNPFKDCDNCEERRKQITAHMTNLREWMRNGLRGSADPSQAVPIKNFPVEKVDKPKT